MASPASVARGDRGERPATERRGEQRARHDPGDGGADVGDGEELRAVGVEEDRAGRDQDPRHQSGRARTPGRPAGRCGAAADSGDGVGASLTRSAARGLCRPRPAACGASVEMTPRAISGRSSSSSSNGPRRRRSSRVGSIAVTDADRGAGASTANSPTTPPGPCLAERPVADVDADPPVGHHEQPVLDRAALDDRCAGLDAHLLEEARHRDEGVTGDVAEQRDPLQHGDALDRHELTAGHPRPQGSEAANRVRPPSLEPGSPVGSDARGSVPPVAPHQPGIL